MKLSPLKNVGIALLISLLFTGCNENENVVYHKVSIAKTGYLVAPLDEKIQYKCGGKSSYLNSDGMFECQSFPVTFYVDAQPIGSISSLHNDGYVFPQDIVKEKEKEHDNMRIASW